MKRIGHRKGMRIAGWALICACALAVLLRLPAALADQSGSWGNLSWNLNTGTGELTIIGPDSGTARMQDFGASSAEAWRAESLRSQIRTVTFQGNVYNIGKSAFSGCENLTGVSFPESMREIGEGAFRQCSSLKEALIPDSVETIGNGAFRSCGSLERVTIPSRLKYIDGYVFCGCESLKEATIPSGVWMIGSYAFSWCSGLTEIEIPETVTILQAAAFQNCSGLLRVSIPGSVTKIEKQTFLNCSGLTEIIIPEGVQTLGEQAFAGCSGAARVEIPSSVTEIGNSAFSGCSGLQEIIIPPGVTKLGMFAFQSCTGLKSAALPEGITVIEAGAFSGCSSLESIIIPSGMTKIDMYAFSYCTGLKHIVIPDTVTTIDANAFEGCDKDQLTLYCSDESCAVQYAASHGMTAVSNGDDGHFIAPAGENATYELYADGTLFIRGSGTLYDYTRNCNGQLSAEDWGTVLEIVVDPRIIISATGETAPSIQTGLAELRLEEGESLDLTGCFTIDACFALDRVTLASGDEEIAAVQEETLTALAFGETELTVSAADWPALSITLPVRVGHHFVDGVCTGCGAICPPAGVMNWLILPEDTVRVEAGAFEKGDFDAVRIPEGCAEIESRAFADCPNLKYVTAGPDTVIAPDAFAGCGSVLVNRGE